MTQNSQSAKQNANRLHGVGHPIHSGMVRGDEQSLPWQVAPTPMKKNNNNNSNNKQRKGRQNIPRSQPKKRNQTTTDRHIRDVVKEVLHKDVDPHELQCAKEYALARTNPFALETLPCAPTSDPGRSVRWRTRARATLVVGSTGNGFVVANPYWGFSDSLPIIDSGDTYTGNGIITNVAGVLGFGVGSQWASTAMARSKVVGFAIRMWYTGKALDAAGMVYKLRRADNQVQTSPVTDLNDIVVDPLNSWSAVQSGQVYFTSFIPMTERDSEFQVPGFAPTNASPHWNMGFFIAGATPGTAFSYEVVGLYEGHTVAPENMTAAIPSPEYKVAGTKVDSCSMNAESKSNTAGPSLKAWKRLMATGIRTSFTNYVGAEAAEAISEFILGEGTTQSTPGLHRHLM